MSDLIIADRLLGYAASENLVEEPAECAARLHADCCASADEGERRALGQYFTPLENTKLLPVLRRRQG